MVAQQGLFRHITRTILLRLDFFVNLCYNTGMRHRERWRLFFVPCPVWRAFLFS